MNKELKPCPYCGGEDIRYSLKTGTSDFKRIYHAAMYCFNCHCYGTRVLIKNPEANRYDVERNEQYRKLAENKWNERINLVK